MAALPKITEYAKNVVKSISYSAVDVAKTNMPTLGAYIDQDSNRDLAKSIYAGVKDYKGTINRAKTAIQSSRIYEAADLGVKSAIEDIKTGKFYNIERIDAINEKIVEAMSGDWDDMDLDFSGGDSSDLTNGDRLVAASVHVSAIKSADLIAQTQIKTTDAVIKSQKAGTQALYIQGANIIGGLKEVAFVGAQTQGAMVALNEIQKTAAENSKKFYESTSKLLQENNNILKEMVEMQRVLYKGQQKKQKDQPITFSDIIGSEGEIDFKSYLSNVKKNAKTTLSSKTGGTLNTLLSGDGNMLNMFASSPLSFMSNYIIAQLIPKNLEKASKNLDKTISGMSSTVIARLNNMAKNDDNPLAQILGSVFGVNTKVKGSLDTSKYNKGAVPFDGIVKKSIVEVIPTYLRRIESALTGSPERIFDSSKGRWTNARQIKQEYDQMFKSNRSSANSELIEEFQKIMNDKKSSRFTSKSEKDEFTKSLERFLDVLYERDGDYRFKSKDDAYEFGINSDHFEQIIDMFTNKKNKSMQRARIRTSNQTLSAKNDITRRMQYIEELGDSPLLQLFNNSTDRENFKTPKYEDKPTAFRGGMSLLNQTDKLGHNVFFYLQNMYKELYTIRNSYGLNEMAPVGMNGMYASSSKFTIPDVHKKDAREIYYSREEDARRRYDQATDRYIRDGGSMYGYDTKSNINKDRNTVQYMNAIAQIDEAYETKGWLNDTLYGDKTKLTALNSKREKDDLIDGKRFMDRFKATKTLSEKLAVLQDQVNRITKAPGNKVTELVERADARIYDFFYGAETGEEDKEGNKITGFMQLMSMKLNATFDKVADFIDTKLFNPIKQKLGVENMKDLMDKMGVTQIWDSIQSKLFGDKDENGKRQGGIFGETRDEIKRVFGGAKDYVVNSIKEVFSPITNKVKEAWANRPKIAKKVYNPNGELIDESYENISESSTKIDLSGLNRLFMQNKDEAITQIKSLLVDELNAKRYNQAAQSVQNCTTYEEARKIAGNIKFLINSRRVSSKSSRNLFSLTDRFVFFFKMKEKDTSTTAAHQAMRNAAMGRMRNTNNISKIGSVDPSKLLPGVARPGKSAFNRQWMSDPLKLPSERLCKQLGIKPDSQEGVYIKEQLYAMAENNPTYDPRHPDLFLNSINLNEVFQHMQQSGFGNNANLQRRMHANYTSASMPLASFIGKGKSPTLTTQTPLSAIKDVLDRILNTFTSVVFNKSVRVHVEPKRYNTSSTPRIFSHAISRRESETEGDSTGDSDGGLHSSAFGNYFSKRSTSALSEGEIYGKNGLFGKVPKTGVYDVKSGTTIYPTKKNKTIELAKEQSAISKFLGITTNAAANNGQTRTLDGKVYSMGQDGKWHNYSKDSNGNMVDRVIEGGFLDQMYNTAKSGISSTLTGLGLSGLANTGVVDTLDSAMEVIKKYAPKMTANGLLGGAVGLLTGNPLLGATIGATTGYVGASEKAKTLLFGDQVADEDGNEYRTGGIISKQTQDTFKKYLPNLGKYGVTGAALGLLSPFGLVGGAILGSTVGWATTNDRVKEALFGNLKDAKSGLISKDLRDKVKKAAPNIAVGTLATVLAGPFGLVGNMVLGSGIGFLSTTNGFQEAILGKESVDEDGNKVRKGGLVGALKVNVVDPLKNFANTFKTKAEDFIINDMINPLKEGMTPIVREMGLLAKGMVGFVPRVLGKMFESTFGRPLQDILRDVLIRPASAIGGRVGTLGLGIGKRVVSAPFKAVGAIGRGLQSKHIRSGNASYISASERLSFRDNNRARGFLSNIPVLGNSVFGSLGFNPTGYRDRYRDIDETLASIEDPESLKSIMDSMNSVSRGKGFFKEESRKTGRSLMADLTAVFPLMVTGRMQRAIKNNDLKTLSHLIRSSKTIDKTVLSTDQAEGLIQKAAEAMSTIEENTRKGNLSNETKKNMFGQLKNLGFRNLSEKNIGKVRNMVQSEYELKKHTNEKTPEQKEADKKAKLVTDPIVESANKNAKDIIDVFKTSIDRLIEIQLASLPPSKAKKILDKQRAAETERGNKALAGLKTTDLGTIGNTKIQYNAETGKITKYVKGIDGWVEDIAEDEIREDKDTKKEPKVKEDSILRGLFNISKSRLDRTGNKIGAKFNNAAGALDTKIKEASDTIKGNVIDPALVKYNASKDAVYDRAGKVRNRIGRGINSAKIGMYLRGALLKDDIDGMMGSIGDKARYLSTSAYYGLQDLQGRATDGLNAAYGHTLAPMIRTGKGIKRSATSKINKAMVPFLNAGALIKAQSGGMGEDGNYNDAKVRYEYNSETNTIEKFVMSSSGWILAPGKSTSNSKSLKEKIQDSYIGRLTSSIGSKLSDIFGLNRKDDDGDRKPSFISKLIKAAGKMLFGATAVAGIGHFSGFVKDTIFPKITGIWDNNIKPFLKEHFGGIYDKVANIATNVVDYVKGVPKRIVDTATTIGSWLSGTGEFKGAGLPWVFEEKIFPWYLEGFRKFATVFLPPIVKTVTAMLPDIIKGIAKGVTEGVKSILNRSDVPEFNTDYGTSANIGDDIYNDSSSGLGKIKPVSGGTKWWSKNGSGLSDIFKSSSKTKTATGRSKDQRDEFKTKTQADLDKLSGKSRAETVASMHENAKEITEDGTQYLNSAYMPTDSKGNTILTNGNIAYDNTNNSLNLLDGTVSMKDRGVKYLGRKLLGASSGKGAFKLLQGTGKLIRKVPIAGLASLLGGGAIEGAGWAASKIDDKIPNLGKHIFGNANLGTMIGDAGSKLAGSKNAAIAKLGSTLSESGLAKAGKEVAETASKTAVDKAAEKAAKNITKETASSTLLTKVTKLIKEGISNLLSSKAVIKTAKEGMEAVGKEATEKAAKEVLEKAGEKIITKMVKKAGEKLAKAGAKLISKITTSVASAGIATVLFAVWDFTSGMAKAKDILGITKSQDIGLFERFLAGLLKCVNGFVTSGLIPESTIVDIFIEYLAPIFKIDVEDLKKRREASDKEREEYNKVNGTKYDSAEEYNNRNSTWNKIKNFFSNGNKVPVTMKETQYNPVAKSNVTVITDGDGNLANLGDGGLGKYGLGRVYQRDPRYAGIPFNTSRDNISQTIGNSGCGPAAAVNAVNYAYGTSNSLEEAAAMAVKSGYKEKNGGTMPGFFKSYFNKNGLHSNTLNSSSDIVNNIKNGSPVVMMGTDRNATGTTPYGPSPHYVVGKGVDRRGNIIVDDPESRYGTSIYPASKVLGKTSLAISASKYGRAKSIMDTTIYDVDNTFAGRNNLQKLNLRNSTPKSKATYVTEKEKYIIGFGSLPFVDKPFSELKDSNVIGTINTALLKLGKTITDQDKNKTVRTVLNNSLHIRMGEIQDFAVAIAKCAGMTVDTLKSENPTVYSKLKTIAKTVLGLDISSFGKKNVGEIVSAMGLNFTGDAPVDNTVEYSANPENGWVGNGFETDMSPSTSIFSKISDWFRSFFNYTDKDGNSKNVLDIIGLGGSSSDNTSSSLTGSNITGLSEQQNKVKSAIESIMGKNKYDQGNRYRVGAALEGASQGSADCSSTTQWALQKVGVDPGGNTAAQITATNGQWVDGKYSFNDNASPDATKLALGDLMFYGKSGSSKPDKVSHVEMYWGDGKRVGHGSGIGPRISDYTAKSSSQRYLGSKRFIPVGATTTNANYALAVPAGSVEQNKKIIWDYLRNKGYSEIAASGIMGNIWQESQFRTDIVQGNRQPTDKDTGVGLFQWTYKTRKTDLLEQVPNWRTNLGGQLNYFFNEVTKSYRRVLPSGLNACSTIEGAVKLFHDIYEGSADTTMSARNNYANMIYAQFATKNSYGTGKYFAKGGNPKHGMASSIVKGGNISSGFNDPTRTNHKGIDIAANRGNSVISPANGTVIRSEYNDTNGNMVVVQSNDGNLHTFAHLDSKRVSVGDRVSIGSIVGTVGSTGNSFGDHLHYQITNKDGQYVDPLNAHSATNVKSKINNPSVRAIGGGDGIDYTQLIRIIIELLGTISDNTTKFTAALNLISEKTGVDISTVNTSSKDKGISQIRERLKAFDSSSGGGRDMGSSMMGRGTSYLVEAMSAIARS